MRRFWLLLFLLLFTSCKPAPPIHSLPPLPEEAMAAHYAALAKTVYVTATGDKYHKLGCQYLGKSSTSLPLDQASQRYLPCEKCAPAQ